MKTALYIQVIFFFEKKNKGDELQFIEKIYHK